ncbi:MAG TPA: hypothetical protein PKC72_14190 [Chitinophagaceae bacterium]|nr:hypothetical protein [Chitinophagaceae bacterium]
MKEKFFLVIAAFAVAALLAFHKIDSRSAAGKNTQYSGLRKINIIPCSRDWSQLKDWLEESDIPPIPGAGAYKWKISTNNDSAQFYFNQGINMYYSFHIIESMASFKKAARFDPSCAMLFWAEALAYGPNINDLGYAASPEALAATQKAVELSATASDMERKLIQAMAVRYTADSTDLNRKSLNEAYTKAMSEVYKDYPDNAEAGTLYADAMMLEHPWDLWKNDGTPKPWTPLIREVLEKVIAKTPTNPGANHYYIHVMEPSPYAAKALASADRLGKLTPGLSHTVHMPSHIYLRTGYYEKGVSVNEAAVKSYERTIPLYEPVKGNDFLYIIHNLHMQTNNAMLAGLSFYSLKAAHETRNSIPKDYLSIPGALGNYIQYIYMTPTLVDVRFGNWNNLLTESKPASELIYATLLWHFGRGMAYSHRQNFDAAAKELDSMRELMKDSTLKIPLSPFSAAIEGATIAEQLLLGDIHLQRKMYDGAVRHFAKADSVESNMVYNEPRDWLLNPKHYLGNAYLKAEQFDKAKDVLEKDLKNNSENGWALYGCWLAIRNGDKKAAELMLQRFKAAFSKADVKLYGPVF